MAQPVYGRVAALSALSSSFGLGTIIGPAVAPLFVLPVLGLAGPLFAFALIAAVVFTSVLLWLPNDRYGRRIVEMQPARVPQLHDRRPRERLGDGGDAVERGGVGCAARGDVGEPRAARPGEPPVIRRD